MKINTTYFVPEFQIYMYKIILKIKDENFIFLCECVCPSKYKIDYLQKIYYISFKTANINFEFLRYLMGNT